MLLLIGSLLPISGLAVLLLLIGALLPVGGPALVLVEGLADFFAGMLTSLDVIVSALASVAEKGWIGRGIGDGGGFSGGFGLWGGEAAGNGQAQKKECLEKTKFKLMTVHFQN